MNNAPVASDIYATVFDNGSRFEPPVGAHVEAPCESKLCDVVFVDGCEFREALLARIIPVYAPVNVGVFGDFVWRTSSNGHSYCQEGHYSYTFSPGNFHATSRRA